MVITEGEEITITYLEFKERVCPVCNGEGIQTAVPLIYVDDFGREYSSMKYSFYGGKRSWFAQLPNVHLSHKRVSCEHCSGTGIEKYIDNYGCSNAT